jgi:hypothetical protein
LGWRKQKKNKIKKFSNKSSFYFSNICMGSMFPTTSFFPPITLPTMPSPFPPVPVDPYVPTLPPPLSPLTPLIPPVNKTRKKYSKKIQIKKKKIIINTGLLFPNLSERQPQHPLFPPSSLPRFHQTSHLPSWMADLKEMDRNDRNTPGQRNSNEWEHYSLKC